MLSLAERRSTEDEDNKNDNSNTCCSVLSVVSNSSGPHGLQDPMDCSIPGFPVFHHLWEFAQTHVESVMLCNHPLSSPSPPALNLSQHQDLFQWVGSLHQVKDWSFSFSPSNKYSGLISFRIDWFDILAVQGTLKSLLQQHSSKASILWRPAFFIVQLSQPYLTTGKTTVLTIWTFAAK